MTPERWRTRRKRAQKHWWAADIVFLGLFGFIFSISTEATPCGTPITPRNDSISGSDAGSINISHPHLDAGEGYVQGAEYQVTVSVDVNFLSNDSKDERPWQTRLSGNETLHQGPPLGQEPSLSVVLCENGSQAFSRNFSISHQDVSFSWTAPTGSVECLSFIASVIQLGKILYSLEKTICEKTGCYHYFHSPNGSVTSERYPQRYADNAICTTFLQVPTGGRIYLQSFDLEPLINGRCYDFVIVTSGRENSRNISQKLCGKYTDAQLKDLSFISDGNFMVIKFLSDGKINGLGYTAVYYTVEESGIYTGCNRVFNVSAGANGTIASLNYPNNYFPNLVCVYSIIPFSGVHVSATITYMDIQEKVDGICNDFIQITTAESDSDMICGRRQDYTVEQLNFVSNGELKIKFASNHMLQRTGFKIDYFTVASCENRSFVDDNGTVSSLNVQGHYLDDQDCYYTIITQKLNHVVHIQFDFLNTHPGLTGTGDMCSTDYVEVFDERNLTRLCGDWNNKEQLLSYRSIGSFLGIHFVSNSGGVATGFKANWRVLQNDSSLIPCPPDWYGLDDSCYQAYHTPVHSWQAAAEQCRNDSGFLATVLSKRINDFLSTLTRNVSQEQSYWIGANDKNVENSFFWEDGSRVHWTGWFPGWEEFDDYNRQPSDDGMGPSDCVELRRKFLYPSKGAGYLVDLYWNDRDCQALNGYICQKYKHGVIPKSSRKPPECSQTLRLGLDDPAGELTSPGYPNEYDDFLQCNITLFAPVGYVIDLQFQAFHLEDQSNCDYDFLELVSQLETKRYCGDWSSKLKLLRYISPADVVNIVFHTDHSRGFTGYHVVYRIMEDPIKCDRGWISWNRRCILVNTNQPLAWIEAKEDCLRNNASMVSIHSFQEHKLGLVPELLAENFTIWVNQVPSGNPTLSSGETESPELNATTKMCSAVLLSESDIQPVSLSNCRATQGYICVWKPAVDTEEPTVVQIRGQLNGTISIPGNASEVGYTNNLHHVWDIKVPDEHRIMFLIDFLDIENQKDCLYDSLSFSDLTTTDLTSDRHTYCGHLHSVKYFAMAGNHARMIFRSDDSTSGRGFNVRWQAIEVHPSYYYDGRHGVVRSINFPLDYLNDLDYNVTIKVPSGNRVWLGILTLQLDSSSADGCLDYLQIYLDSSDNSSAKLCASNKTNAMINFLSNNDTVVIVFHSDSAGTDMGFELNYTAVPLDMFGFESSLSLDPNTPYTIQSPNYPYGYPVNFTQSISLTVPLGSVVDLSILRMDLLDSDNCSEQALSVVDILIPEEISTNSNVITLCENSGNITSFRSYLNALEVRFYGFKNEGGRNSLAGVMLQASVVRDPLFVNKTVRSLGVAMKSCGEFPCYNGALCGLAEEPIVGFACQCPASYTGLLCAWKHCDSSPCRNDGVCQNTDATYNCSCTSGFIGRQCQMDRDECMRNQCSGHGDCYYSEDWTLFCRCHQGYEGAACSAIVRVPLQKTAQMRLLEEPFWIGIIVVLSVLIITGIVVFIRKKCALHYDIECCREWNRKSPTREEIDAGNGRSRHWSLQLPDGLSNYAFSSAEGTPKSNRTVSSAHTGNPTIKVEYEGSSSTLQGGSHSDDNSQISRDPHNTLHPDYVPGTGTHQDDIIITTSDDETPCGAQAHRLVLRMDGTELELPDSPVIHLHRAKSVNSVKDLSGREPTHRGARRCHSTDSRPSDSDESPERHRRPSTTFEGAVTLGNGQALNVVAYNGPVVGRGGDGMPADDMHHGDLLSAPVERKDVRGFTHQRVNSAQRRKDFANAVRMARELNHQAQTQGQNQANPCSGHHSGGYCCQCVSPASTVSLYSHSREYRDSVNLRLAAKQGRSSRSFDLCGCKGGASVYPDRPASVCGDGSCEKHQGDVLAFLESSSSGYHSRRGSKLASGHRHHHSGSDRNVRSGSRRSHKHRASRTSQDSGHWHRSHRQSSSHGSHRSSHCGHHRSRDRSHRSHSASRRQSGPYESRHGQSHSIDFGHEHFLDRTLPHSHSCTALERPDSRCSIPSIHSSRSVRSSAGYDSRHSHHNHRQTDKRDSGEFMVRGDDSRHHRDYKDTRDGYRDKDKRRKAHRRHRDHHRYSDRDDPRPAHRDRHPLRSKDKHSERPVRELPSQEVQPGPHRRLERTVSIDWLSNPQTAMDIQYLTDDLCGHRRLEPTHSNTSNDSRLSLPEARPGLIRPLKKSHSMDIRPEVAAKARPMLKRDRSSPDTQQFSQSGSVSTTTSRFDLRQLSSLSSNSMDNSYTSYEMSRRSSAFSRTGSLTSLPVSQLGDSAVSRTGSLTSIPMCRQLLAIPAQDSVVLSDSESFGGNSSENSGSGKMENQHLESSSGISSAGVSRETVGEEDHGEVETEQEDEPNGAGWVSISSMDMTSLLSPLSAMSADQISSLGIYLPDLDGSPPPVRRSQPTECPSPEEGQEEENPPECAMAAAEARTPTPGKQSLRDSAYQSKEQSTEKYNGSTEVSPTLSYHGNCSGLYRGYKAPPIARAEDKRITNQLELAARKLAGIRSEEAGTEEDSVSEQSPDVEFIQLQRLDQPAISGTLSFFFHNPPSLVHPKPRRLFPSRMLSMIADEELETDGNSVTTSPLPTDPSNSVPRPLDWPNDTSLQTAEIDSSNDTNTNLSSPGLPNTLAMDSPRRSPTHAVELSMLEKETSDDASDDHSDETSFSVKEASTKMFGEDATSNYSATEA